MKLTEKQKNCPYCHGKANLMFSGLTNDGDYNRIWIDDQGRLQQRTDAMSYVVCDTVADDEGVQLNYCPMCGRGFNE